MYGRHLKKQAKLLNQMSEENESKKNGQIIFLLFLLCIFIIFYFAANKINNLTPDSLSYIHAAQQFSQNRSFGDAYIYWPPLYPILLSLFSMMNIGANTFASLINTILYGWLLLSLGVIAKQQFRLRKICFVMLLVTLLSGPVEQIYKTTWSEALFLPLCVSTTYCWIQFLSDKNRLRNFLLSICLLSLVLLTRHVGIALFVAMLFSLFYPTARRTKEELTYAAAIIASTAPYLFWLFRTKAISGFLMGPRTPASNPDLALQINRYGNTIAHWIFPHFYFEASGLFVSSILSIGLLVFFIYANSKISEPAEQKKQNQVYQFRIISFLIVYTVAHSFLVLSSAYRFNLDPINDRLLAPIFWPLILIVFFLIDLFWKYAQNKLRKPYLKIIQIFGACYVLFWLTSPNALNDVLLRALFLLNS